MSRLLHEAEMRREKEREEAEIKDELVARALLEEEASQIAQLRRKQQVVKSVST